MATHVKGKLCVEKLLISQLDYVPYCREVTLLKKMSRMLLPAAIINESNGPNLTCLFKIGYRIFNVQDRTLPSAVCFLSCVNYQNLPSIGSIVRIERM